MAEANGSGARRLALISSRGTLDWAYPPFILGSTAGAMGWEVGIFFTFYGLPLLKKELSTTVSPGGNPAMPMKMPFGSDDFQKIDWPVPNVLANNLPGFETMATNLMKKTFAKKGVATIGELREACLDTDVRLIGCQMTMEVFGFAKEDFIDGCEIGGAATFLEYAASADVSLFV